MANIVRECFSLQDNAYRIRTKREVNIMETKERGKTPPSLYCLYFRAETAKNKN